MPDAIAVAVRMRPLNKSEISSGGHVGITIEGQTVAVHHNDEQHKGKDHQQKTPFAKTGTPVINETFEFDYCYNESTSQDTVMHDLGEPILVSSTSGINVCLFAYGSTGCGKTFSVTGTKKMPGIVPRVIEQLYDRMQNSSSSEVRIKVSYLEIYNEHIHDLLAPSAEHEDLKITDHPRLGVVVQGLTEVPCASKVDVDNLLKFGQQKRAVSATKMNSTSSRSHTVFSLKVAHFDGPRPEPGVKDRRHALVSKISLVDLAGSERLSKTEAKGKQAKEGQSINRCLLALANIIKELANIAQKSDGVDASQEDHLSEKEHAEKQVRQKRPDALRKRKERKDMRHLGFRTSKLTFLLRDSLIGNSKTCMIAAISPSISSIHDSLSTLRFAASVKKVKLTAVQNKENREETLEQMKRELESLRQQHGIDEQKLQEEEKLIEDLKRSYEAELAKGEEILSSRADAIKNFGLTQTDLSSTFHVSDTMPYLVNMSNDPALAGCLLFYIPRDRPVTVGSKADNSIKVSGPGIPDELCVIENQDDSKLKIRKCGDEGRVTVNGESLRGDGAERELQHNNRLFLGRVLALKVVKPMGSARDTGEHAHDDLELAGLEKEWAAIEESPSWGKLQTGLEQLMETMSVEQVKEFTDHLEQLVHACDEANDLSTECRPEGGLSFEVEILPSPPVSSCVRVLQAQGPLPVKSVDGDAKPLLVCIEVWSAREMLERLDRMRDAHHILEQTGRLVVTGSLDDPWHVPTNAEIKHALADVNATLEHEVDERARDKVNFTRLTELKESAEAASTSLERELSAAQQELATSESAAVKQSELKESTEAANVTLERELIVTRRELAASESAATKHTELLDRAEAASITVERELSATKDELIASKSAAIKQSELNESTEVANATLERNLIVTRELLAASESAATKHTELFDRAEAANIDFEKEMSTAKEELTALKSAAIKHTDLKASAGAASITFERELNAAREELAASKAAATKQTEMKESAEAANTILERELSAAKEELAASKSATTKREELDVAKANVSSAGSAPAMPKADLLASWKTSDEFAIAKLKEELAAAHAKSSSAEFVVAKLKEELACQVEKPQAIELNTCSDESAVAKLRGELSDAQAEIAEAIKAKNSSAESPIIKLKEELADAHTENNELKQLGRTGSEDLRKQLHNVERENILLRKSQVTRELELTGRAALVQTEITFPNPDDSMPRLVPRQAAGGGLCCGPRAA